MPAECPFADPLIEMQIFPVVIHQDLQKRQF